MTAIARAVTFDFGQTLADFDPVLLSVRVRERGACIEPDAVERAMAPAWAAYEEAKRGGLVGKDVWCCFMRTLLELGGLQRDSGAVTPKFVDELTDWLFAEQRNRNLWRRPVKDMLELVGDLEARGIPLGIISNSEGRLFELLVELGWASHFRTVADSGVIGVEKPDPKIFQISAERLGVETSELVHVGDAWEADVRGALGAGARAIWFCPREQRPLPERVASCRSAAEVRESLARWGI